MQYLISDHFLGVYHSFQLYAHQKLLFDVSMETDKICQIQKLPKNLWVNITKIFSKAGWKISALQAKTEAKSPHFQISMATVQNL